MNPSAVVKRPQSLRLRLIAALSLVVAVLWLGAALVTSRILSHEMNEVFDASLQETGQRVLQLAVLEILGRDDEGNSQDVAALDAGPEFYTYVVRDAAGQVLLTSLNADAAGFPHLAGNGFDTRQNLRLYQETAVSGTIILTIAEPLQHRQGVARTVAMALAVPLLALIPLSVMGIAYGLGFGLRPLAQLRRQLSGRGGADLSPLALGDVPEELRPIAITLNQLFARLEGAMAAERAFAANAAHELRTPLAGAVAGLQRLRDQTMEAETAQRAHQIEAALKRLARLSEKLIQLARAEGAQLLTAQPCDLRQIISLVADDFKFGLAEGRMEMVLPDEPVPSNIDADAVAIVARNLIENALRHGDKVTVNLSANGTLQVQNDGPSVAPEDLAKLGTRFQRGQAGGSGLGLAILRTIADRIGTPLTLTSPNIGQSQGFCATIQLVGQVTAPDGIALG